VIAEDVLLVGRKEQLSELDRFLSAERMERALVFAGGAGIGKTTLWRSGVALASERGLRVLVTRASDAEAHLAWAGLGDLLDGIDVAAADWLPLPQRRALAAATLRSEAAEPPEEHAVAAAVLSALRGLAMDQPVLVAIDDVQWLDRDSTIAIGFAARRLERSPVRFLLTTRSAGTAALEQAFEGSQRQILELGPLSRDATRRMLAEQLGLILPRRVLRRLHAAAEGNPLFALELGRALGRREPSEMDDELGVPASLDELLAARVSGLAAGQRRLLLAVGLGAGASWRQLEAVSAEDALRAALDSGLLVAAGARVRPAHPLLAATAARLATPRERRALHLDLASATEDEQHRVLHLALAAEHPDVELSSRLARAAARAAAHGAAGEAVELAGHALRLTAPDARERPERLLALGERLEAVGEFTRLSELLQPEVDALPPGEPRVRAHLLLAEGGHVRHADQHAEHLARALAEAAGEPALRAPVLAMLSIHASVTRAAQIGEAETLALEALEAARSGNADADPLALGALAWARALSGRAVDSLRAVPGAAAVDRSVERVAAVRLVWRGQTEAARAALSELLAAAEERGEDYSYLVARLHTCELELRVGDWTQASQSLEELVESADLDQLRGLVHERCRTLLAAGRGNPEEAERSAGRAIAAANTNGVSWQLLETLRARGLARLLAHDPRAAAADLDRVWAAAEREGIDDPGTFPVAPDLVEALLESGEHDRARAVTARLQALSAAQHHPWGLVSARRCTALLEHEPDTAEEIAAAYEQLGLPFDRARTLLALGRVARRRRRWGLARQLLEPATAGFRALGSDGWAEEARSELDRVGGRRATPPGELTTSEQRVVELAARGLSNKEIARELYVSVHTVERHLSHSYAKLGVRSRSQLARAID
jgi:DNA-binding CsgD family transcriptional regulator